jgi:hypothetical protein
MEFQDWGCLEALHYCQSSPYLDGWLLFTNPTSQMTQNQLQNFKQTQTDDF